MHHVLNKLQAQARSVPCCHLSTAGAATERPFRCSTPARLCCTSIHPVPVPAPHICLRPHLPALCCRMSRDLNADIYGPHIPWREYSFMSNPRLPQAVLDSVVMLEVCQVCAPARWAHPRLHKAVLDSVAVLGVCALARLLEVFIVDQRTHTEQAPGWGAESQPCVRQCWFLAQAMTACPPTPSSPLPMQLACSTSWGSLQGQCN